MTAEAMLYAQEYMPLYVRPRPSREPRRSVWTQSHIEHLCKVLEPGPRAVIEIGNSANWFDGTIPWIPGYKRTTQPESVNYPRGVGPVIEFDKGPAMALFLEIASDDDIEHINEGRARNYPFLPLLSRPNKRSPQ